MRSTITSVPSKGSVAAGYGEMSVIISIYVAAADDGTARDADAPGARESRAASASSSAIGIIQRIFIRPANPSVYP